MNEFEFEIFNKFCRNRTKDLRVHELPLLKTLTAINEYIEVSVNIDGLNF